MREIQILKSGLRILPLLAFFVLIFNFHNRIFAPKIICGNLPKVREIQILEINFDWKSEDYGQTVLPDKSLLIGQKLMANAKIVKFKWDIFGYFQTMCRN